MRLIYLIITSLIFVSSSLSALSYQETVRAYEEALENQSVTVYLLKQQREEERNRQIIQAYRNIAMKYKETELQRMIQESNERLAR